METPLHELFTSWGAEFGRLDGVELPLRVAGAGPEYEAAREGTALFDGGDRGWLEIEGEDAVDFLQRLLSSDVPALGDGGWQWSALLDGRGHWVADLILFRFGDRIEIDLPASREDAVEQALDRLHFGERLAWRRPRPARLLVAGPGAEAAVAGLGLPPAGEGPIQVLRRPDRGVECLELLGPPEEVAAHGERLRAAGAVPAGLVALDILRVEAAEPRWGTDFNETVTLPESNEWRRVSFTKGCYPGQEVVARVNAYGEAPRQLCRLRFDGGTTPLAGCPLVDEEGKRLGRVSSWVWSPLRDEPIGLGTVRRRAAHNGARLLAAADDGARVGVTVEVPEKVHG
ncbi:MAG: aminomethyl transferase family protein [Planctomycetota bacterium]|nr:MAG: aminomethyl transferase family protein [Planctomycetota bacterium]